MTYTEEEARGKFCPVAMASSDDYAGFCFASKCMAWRWAGYAERKFIIPENPKEHFQEEEPERPYHLPASWKWDGSYDEDEDDIYRLPNRWIEPKNEVARLGYCGLVWRPE